jgi:hypothetical protein
MRLHATKESLEKSELSLLAICETVLALAGVLLLSAKLASLKWLAFTTVVTPLLLLRTEQSTIVASNFCQHIGLFFERSIGPIVNRLFGSTTQDKKGSQQARDCLVAVLRWMMGAALTILTVVISAALATIVTTLRYPLATLKCIPANWARVVFSLDTTIPPKISAGHRTHGQQSDSSNARVEPPAPVLPLWTTILPVLIYRWSLKATSIAYAPLMFVVYSTFRERTDSRTKLVICGRGDLVKAAVVCSVLVVLAFVAKLVLMTQVNGFAEWWHDHPVKRIAAIYAAPSEIPNWQLSWFINALLAITGFVICRDALYRLECGFHVPGTTLQRMLGVLAAIRLVLSIYSIVCMVYITVEAARKPDRGATPPNKGDGPASDSRRADPQSSPLGSTVVLYLTPSGTGTATGTVTPSAPFVRLLASTATKAV